MSQGQTQAGALAGNFSGEEGLENDGTHRLRDAGSVITNPYLDVARGQQIGDELLVCSPALAAVRGGLSTLPVKLAQAQTLAHIEGLHLAELSGAE